MKTTSRPAVVAGWIPAPFLPSVRSFLGQKLLCRWIGIGTPAMWQSGSLGLHYVMIFSWAMSQIVDLLTFELLLKN